MEDDSKMRYHSRMWVRPENLNANGTLFGGHLLAWIDEQAALYAIVQLGNERVVTKYMSEINFVSSAWQGDIIELGIVPVKFGRTSLVLRCDVRNMVTRESIITVDRIVMVSLDDNGRPLEHGYHEITFARDRIPHRMTPIPRPEPVVPQVTHRPLGDLDG